MAMRQCWTADSRMVNPGLNVECTPIEASIYRDTIMHYLQLLWQCNQWFALRYCTVHFCC